MILITYIVVYLLIVTTLFATCDWSGKKGDDPTIGIVPVFVPIFWPIFIILCVLAIPIGFAALIGMCIKGYLEDRKNDSI